MSQKKTVERPDLVERWKGYVLAGNKNLVDQELSAAARQYELARQCAESLFKQCLNPAEAVSALVVTYHNIADLQRKQGNTDSIRYYLQTVHDTILRALTSTPIGDKRHDALFSASTRTYSALVSFKKYGVYY